MYSVSFALHTAHSHGLSALHFTWHFTRAVSCCRYLDSAVVAVEDVHALLWVCLVNDDTSVAFVILHSPLPAQDQLCLRRGTGRCCRLSSCTQTLLLNTAAVGSRVIGVRLNPSASAVLSDSQSAPALSWVGYWMMLQAEHCPQTSSLSHNDNYSNNNNNNNNRNACKHQLCFGRGTGECVRLSSCTQTSTLNTAASGFKVYAVKVALGQILRTSGWVLNREGNICPLQRVCGTCPVSAHP